MVECEFVGDVLFEGFIGRKCKLSGCYCCGFGDARMLSCPDRLKQVRG